MPTIVYLSSEQWQARAVQARRVAAVASRQDAQILREFAEDCDTAAALLLLGHLPVLDEPRGIRLRPTLVADAGRAAML